MKWTTKENGEMIHLINRDTELGHEVYYKVLTMILKPFRQSSIGDEHVSERGHQLQFCSLCKQPKQLEDK